MTKPTKDQIDGATGEQLSEWVAVWCMGWHPAEVWKDGKIVHTTFTGEFTPTEPGEYAWRYLDLARFKGWQPHLPTEKGKAQCWDIVCKLVKEKRLGFVPANLNFAIDDSDGYWISEGDNPQEVVLRAYLYSVIGEE